MPPKRNLGKAAQTLQIGLGDGSPAHSEGENEPIIPPPLSPILGEHSFVNPTFNKASEFGDDAAQSGDSLVKAVSDQISIMRHTLMESEEKARQRSQEAFRRVRIEPQPQAADLQRQNQNIPAPALGGQVNLPQPPPQIQQAADGPMQPDPVEAAPCVADLGNHQQPRYLPPPRRPNGGHPQHNAPPQMEHFQPYVSPVQQNVPNLPGQYINRDQIIDMVQEAYGLVLRHLVRPAYRKPYPYFINQENPFPRGFKVPKFTQFFGDGGYSTIEHVGCFTIQCGEASGDDNLKLRLFPSSLTSTALTCEPEVSMADLSRLVQRPGETSEAFLARFRKARLKCRVALPEQEFVKLAQNGLDIELRKKFEGMEFRDFFELSYKVARYENLLREDTQRKSASHGTYYGDANFDLDMAEVVADKPVVCPYLVKVAQQTDRTEKIDKGILHFLDKAKETMGVDTDPFPTMSVGVNAADLRSIARDRSQTYYRRRLAADDLRWVIEEARACRNQPRMVKPPPRSPSKRWEHVVHPKFPKGQNPRTLRRHLQRKRAAERHRQQITDSGGMADQAQPLPARRKSVWVRKEKGSTSGQNSPEKEELSKSPTSPRILAVESNEETGLKVKFDMSDKAKNSSDVICFGEFFVNLSCLVITLPLVFQAKEQSESAVCHQTDLTEEEVIEIPTKEDGDMDSADKIIFEKPKKRMARHIRPLYIHAHLDGMPINRVLVDNGAAVNVLPTCILHKIGKSLGDLMETEVTISDFIGGVNRSRGILPVELTVGNRTLMCAFFVVDTIATYNALLGRDWIHSSCTNAVEARYYDEDIGTIRFFGMDRYGRPFGITACTRSAMDRQTVKEKKEAVEEIKRKLAAYLAEKRICVDRSEVVYEGEEEDFKDQITLEELDLAPAKLDDLKAEVQDPLEEVNLGTEVDPKITFISSSLEPCLHDKIINILHEYKDCFAWDYSEMPGLDRNLVEHILPIRPDFKPFTQPPRRMSPEVTLKVKEEIERLLKVGFIRTSRYVEWLSNVVPVVKKNGKLRICVDFSNLNLATPKDEYPMPIADLLVDGAARHRILSFIDGHSGAMNAIFHDMIGRFMEIYIDDVVVKSNEEEEHLEHLKLAFERMRKHGLKMNPLKCAFGVSAGNFLGYLAHERGLEVDQNKARAVIEAQPPRRKTRVFSPLLKLKLEADFKWEKHHQIAFEEIKHYLSKPPVLVPPLRGKPLILYISAADESVGCLLAQENSKKQEQAVYYLSRKFNLKYMPQKAVKGQALADFLADHPCLEVEADEEKGINLFSISLVPWKLIFDGSSTDSMSGAGIVIISPAGLKTQMSFQLDFNCTNNQAEYEALIIGLEVLVELKVPMVGIIGDSQLILKQLEGEYKCTSLSLAPYFALAVQLLEEFDDVILRHVTRDLNTEANEMAQIASGLKIPEGVMSRIVVVEKRILPSIHMRGMVISACSIDVTQTDWRYPIMEYLKNPNFKASRKTKMQALNYVLLEGVLYRRGYDELPLRCLGPDEYCQIMSDVHNGICDCISYAKGCKAYQIHGPLQRVPASKLHPIVKPWPFRGWAIDLISKVYPPSTRGHSFIIVATDYFTKWVEAKPMKKVDQTDIIKFLTEEIIHRFGLPETVTSDQGTVFVGAQVEVFAKEMGFRLLTSTPHYAQANGQAEASNRIVINLLEKMVDDNPRCWHELLSDTI
ncbi:hypothetical protein SLEP1_g53027 [Rubroshorea leprosula]|uniref:Uncharacterized protein n=1 Tax=Rubroshorea leprosula TaxID=152421 RepID=A0AAV5M9W6_9ROSI|nr:hypothetical protein SLEP1_g53027 [Rubroshorea leprosula]